MVEVQDFQAMGEALGDAGAILRNNAGGAGLAARVPTTPEWSVEDLVVHVGVVHRRTGSYLSGVTRPDVAAVLTQAAEADDLLDWFDEGLVDLLNVFAAAPDDVAVTFFLPDAPPPRDAWLRRQVHELSVHAIDAMAARLGRAPRAAELWLDPHLAADGVDEVLTGFLVREPLLTAPAGRRVRVDATDVDRSWLLRLGPAGVSTSRVGGDEPADDVVSGTARELYLRVWNRGEGGVSSDPAFWDTWRDAVKVVWS